MGVPIIPSIQYTSVRSVPAAFISMGGKGVGGGLIMSSLQLRDSAGYSAVAMGAIDPHKAMRGQVRERSTLWVSISGGYPLAKSTIALEISGPVCMQGVVSVGIAVYVFHHRMQACYFSCRNLRDCPFVSAKPAVAHHAGCRQTQRHEYRAHNRRHTVGCPIRPVCVRKT